MVAIKGTGLAGQRPHCATMLAAKHYFASLAEKPTFPRQALLDFVGTFDETGKGFGHLTDLAMLKVACRLVNLFSKEFALVLRHGLCRWPCALPENVIWRD